MVFGSINVHFEITTTGVLSYLVACCKIVSRIKWKVVRDLCKDIYELTLKEDDYPNGPVDLIDLFIPDKGIDQDPLEVFEKLYSNAEKVFLFVVFVVWLSRTYPGNANHYYKEITHNYAERCPSVSKLVTILLSLRHAQTQK